MEWGARRERRLRYDGPRPIDWSVTSIEAITVASAISPARAAMLPVTGFIASCGERARVFRREVV